MERQSLLDGAATGLVVQADWEARVSGLLESGQTFMAQDLADQGLARFPGSHQLRILRALALMRTGAAEDALQMIEPLFGSFAIDEAPFQAVLEAFRRTMDRVEGQGSNARMSKATIDAISDLAGALDAVRGKRSLVHEIDGETLRLLGELYAEAWRGVRDERVLKRAYDLSFAAFDATADPSAGLDAAIAAWLLGRKRQARELARQLVLADEERPDQPAGDAETGEESGRAAFARHVLLGTAQLLMQQPAEAEASYRAARAALGSRSEAVVAALRQARLLHDHGIPVPPAVFEILRPPGVVVFTGHMMDRPDQAAPRLTPALEGPLRAEIERRLDAMDVQIGYSSAACGSDLLFIEAMLQRDAEVNIILPFAQDDFIEANVAYAGARWSMRFRNALKLAHSVTYATTERHLGHDSLYRFANQMLHGTATLRARFLDTEPSLLAVWDMTEGSLIGGAADFIDQWTDINRLQIVDLDFLEGAAEATAAAAEAPAPKPSRRRARPPRAIEPERVIRAMLFADIVGFSKLEEGNIPAYMAMLRKLKEAIHAGNTEPEAINTWGDAMFVVMERATDLVAYALRLKHGIQSLGTAAGGLGLNIRISLHAGPVFPGIDPFHARPNFYGAHINRAARLEPVTVPGHIYATQQFVALLAAEESAERAAAEGSGTTWAAPCLCEYVGVLSLAKNFGTQPVYHIREAPAVVGAAAA